MIQGLNLKKIRRKPIWNFYLWSEENWKNKRRKLGETYIYIYMGNWSWFIWPSKHSL